VASEGGLSGKQYAKHRSPRSIYYFKPREEVIGKSGLTSYSSIHIILGFVIACILATGCVTNNDTDNRNMSPADTFSPFSVPSTKGQLTISVGGFAGEYPVSVDERSAGVVTAKRPITMMIEEGNHTVEVCCGTICEHQDVIIKFAKQRTIDFSEQLKKDLEFSEPAVRIINYNVNRDQIIIDVEFINPTTEILAMSAEISCGYSYIERNSNQRVGNSAHGHLYETVKPCDHIIQKLNLDLASGSNYNYDIPTITQVSSKKF
jgi:hypothetical protein